MARRLPKFASVSLIAIFVTQVSFVLVPFGWFVSQIVATVAGGVTNTLLLHRWVWPALPTSSIGMRVAATTGASLVVTDLLIWASGANRQPKTVVWMFINLLAISQTLVRYVWIRAQARHDTSIQTVGADTGNRPR